MGQACGAALCMLLGCKPGVVDGEFGERLFWGKISNPVGLPSILPPNKRGCGSAGMTGGSPPQGKDSFLK